MNLKYNNINGISINELIGEKMKAEIKEVLEAGNKVWAYWRVSTSKQKMERQIHHFNNLGIEGTYVFGDKVTGKSQAEDRNEYTKLKMYLSSGDYLVIKNLDRLGRNKENITREYWDLVDMGIHILVADTPYLSSDSLREQAERQANIFKDFTMKTGNDLLDKFIQDLQDLIRDLMVGMIDQQLENEAERAQAERESIVLRVQEGVTLAKKRVEAEGGHWGGRKAVVVTPEIKEIMDLWNDRRILQREVLEKLKKLGVGRTTAYRLKREIEG